MSKKDDLVSKIIEREWDMFQNFLYETHLYEMSSDYNVDCFN